MPSGGHAQSGPPPDPNSLKSAKRGLSLAALPAEGYQGDIPPFPLPKIKVFEIYFEDKQRVKEFDAETTAARYEREVELWAQTWRTPQAEAWAREPWRWQTIAMYVRTMVVCESGEATAADKNSVHRFADQIGMTPAGLAYNGWKIAADQVGAKRAEKAPTPVAPSARTRLKAINGGGA
jgi:hypothetical protein